MVENFRLNFEQEILLRNVDAFNVRWNFEGSILAVGTSGGYVQLHGENFELEKSLNCQSGAEKMPVTSLRFKPSYNETHHKEILLATTCDGGSLHWNASNGKAINTSRSRGEQIYSSDFNMDGSNYVLGCKEGKIKLFDSSTYSQINEFSHIEENEVAQRVFCLKWFDEHLFLSAGWEDKITIWDHRVKGHIKEVLGPHVCGDAVDVRDNYIVSGSFHARDQLQVWALDSCRNISTTLLEFNGRKCMPYSVQFIKPEGLTVAVGGQGSGEVYFYDISNMRLAHVLPDIQKTVYSIHASVSNKLAIAMGNSVRIYST